MWALLCYCTRSGQIRSLTSALLTKRGCPCPIGKSWPPSNSCTQSDQQDIFNVQKRTLIRKRETSVHMRAQYKEDKIEPGFEFIYASTNLNYYMWGIPACFICVALIFILSGKIVIEQHWFGKEFTKLEMPSFFDDVDAMPVAYCASVYTFFILILLLRYLRTVLLRLYYNKSSKEYIAVILKYGLLKNKVYFKAKDVVEMKKVVRKGNVSIKGMHVSCSESGFVSIPAYHTFMGYRSASTGDIQNKQEHVTLDEVMASVAKRIDKERSDKFVEKYKEKRKFKQRKR